MTFSFHKNFVGLNVMFSGCIPI